MKRIIEIPIYAFSEKEFLKRVSIDKDRFFSKYSYSENEYVQLAYDQEKGSKKTWRHNHIVGYIDIIKKNNDITFKLFLPLTSSLQKYYWTSNKKIFLQDNMINGYHFSLLSCDSNVEILNKIDIMLDGIMDRYIPKRFYLDREIYDNIKHMIDFINL